MKKYICPYCGEAQPLKEYKRSKHHDEAGNVRYTCPECLADIIAEHLEAEESND
jgi:predicted RNA-binding Zn-ribbon protein involved in translation (DUF1610 family)